MTEKKTERNPEVRVYGVARPVCNGLHNIAKNLGIEFAAFMKPHLRDILEKYPEHMRNPPRKD